MHPPRLRHFSYVGLHRYFLTVCTDGRRPVFVSEQAVSPVLAQFRQSATASGFAILAYCLMPDHLHLLQEAEREDAALLPSIALAKQLSGHAFSLTAGRRLWERGFYDHVLRDEDGTLAVINYIIGNPVRAGIRRSLGEYEFCGSDKYSMEEICACTEIWCPPRRMRWEP
jgi:REP element-mobilizing transposase RayT